MTADGLCVDCMGCQQAMCPHCDYLQICPLHNRIESLRAEIAAHEMSSVGHNGDGVSQDSHDMTKCPDCERCISDLRVEKAALRERAEKAEKERDELARTVVKHVRWHRMVDAPYKHGTHRCMGCWAPAWQDETDEDSNNRTMRCEHLPGCPVVLAGQVLREEAEDEADRD